MDSHDLSSESAMRRGMSKRAFDIEKNSLMIIDLEISDHDYNRREWEIVRRVIHATADFDFATTARIMMHRDAIDSAFVAFERKCTIVADVDMVLSGLNKKSISGLGIKAVCHVSDTELIELSSRLNKTRSEMAMRHAATEMDEGIVVIGNAPTALFETMKMIREQVTKPALVIGVPVGFVSARESKEELSKIEIPFITNRGRKGGSSVASSIMNALMLLFTEHRKTEHLT